MVLRLVHGVLVSCSRLTRACDSRLACRGREQFARLPAGRLRDPLAREHTRQFLDALAMLEYRDMRRGPPPGDMLGDRQVVARQGRDQGQVGDADDLAVLRQAPESLPDRLRDSTTNAGIYFVKIGRAHV